MSLLLLSLRRIRLSSHHDRDAFQLAKEEALDSEDEQDVVSGAACVFLLLLGLRKIRTTASTSVLLLRARKKKRPTERTSRLWPLALLSLTALLRLRQSAAVTSGASPPFHKRNIFDQFIDNYLDSDVLPRHGIHWALSELRP